MTRFNNPLAPKANRLQAKSAEIKQWVRELMELPEDATLTVAELACREEGCPDIETVIGILEPERPIISIRIHLPMAEVKRTDVADAAGAGIKVENR
ncbi:nitrate reductase [Hoeflea sp.]|uniref:nitrate reductase n=1 Tax=Hoeflea sp. TaxID=1940281 RepID=UPI003B0161D2